MDATIREILESKAREQADTEKTIGDVVIPIGGGSGSVLGVMAGKGVKGRMAGGLIGLLAGGGLGEVAKRELLGDNRPAELLAAIQVQGGLTPGQARELESMVADSYSARGLPFA
jgi:hypothetical protein